MPRRKKTVEVEQTTNPIGAGIARKQTGLFSFDLAVGGGLPLYSITELSGKSHVGKSTLAGYLCGVCAYPDKSIGILDLETVDSTYPIDSAKTTGWIGAGWIVPGVEKEKPRLHEDMMDDLVDRFLEDESMYAVMVDSIGAFRAAAEFEGSVGEANIGVRARVVGKFIGKMNHCLKVRPAHMVCINHQHTVIGGMVAGGTVTSGGEAMSFFPSVRAKLWSRREDTHWITEGKVFKLRYRNDSLPKREDFKVVILPGLGVHRGLTAVEDCILLGLAERDKVIKLNGQSYGYFAKMVEAHEDEEMFVPFHEALHEAIKLS